MGRPSTDHSWTSIPWQVIREIRDADGQTVVLLERIWNEKITRDHPEILADVPRTVEAPHHLEPDPVPQRRRSYRQTDHPSRWLMVVVRYEQQPARIITALATRKAPRQWNH